MHQAEAVRLVHIDRCSFEGELERLRRAEHPCQSLGSAAAGNEAAQRFDLAEQYMLGIRRIAQVAGQRNLVPAAQRGTVDGRHIDGTGPVHPQCRLLPAMEPHQARAETAAEPLNRSRRAWEPQRNIDHPQERPHHSDGHERVRELDHPGQLTRIRVDEEAGGQTTGEHDSAHRVVGVDGGGEPVEITD